MTQVALPENVAGRFDGTTVMSGGLPYKVFRKGDQFWAEMPDVGDYQGSAWYRARFTVPPEWKGRTIRVLFGSVDEEAWVYVNGIQVGEHSVASTGKPIDELWEEPFAVEIAPENIEFGGENVLAVRVNNAAANGGIWRPVLVHALPAR